MPTLALGVTSRNENLTPSHIPHMNDEIRPSRKEYVLTPLTHIVM